MCSDGLCTERLPMFLRAMQGSFISASDFVTRGRQYADEAAERAEQQWGERRVRRDLGRSGRHRRDDESLGAVQGFLMYD